jgi:hypothetical protein
MATLVAALMNITNARTGKTREVRLDGNLGLGRRTGKETRLTEVYAESKNLPNIFPAVMKLQSGKLI